MVFPEGQDTRCGFFTLDLAEAEAKVSMCARRENTDGTTEWEEVEKEDPVDGRDVDFVLCLCFFLVLVLEEVEGRFVLRRGRFEDGMGGRHVRLEYGADEVVSFALFIAPCLGVCLNIRLPFEEGVGGAGGNF